MLKTHFLLDPEVIFLNHGSFGACPKEVFEVYQGWQLRLEQQPVKFLGRELVILLKEARSALSQYIGANPDEVVYIPNVTFGVNLVARSLRLGPGDEILTSDHEYGACKNAWDFLCRRTGAHCIHQALHLPIQAPDEFLQQLWQAVTPQTRLIFLSHITSPTAQRLPVEAICQKARQAGILTFIDGAHAPGQIPLNLHGLGVDFYTGNAHKWMLSPKGAAFLYTRPELQERIEPLVVSWGYCADEHTTTGSRYVDLLQWSGTHDPSAALSVPAAIEFMHAHNWDVVRNDCNRLLRQALGRIAELTGIPGVYPTSFSGQQPALPPQMGIAPLPRLSNPAALKAKLYDEFRIEIPVIEWNDGHFLRISVQGYNTESDINSLVEALAVLLPEMRN